MLPVNGTTPPGLPKITNSHEPNQHMESCGQVNRDSLTIDSHVEADVNGPHWGEAALGVSLPSVRWKSSRIKKLDHLRWTAGASFTIFGVRIGVRANAREDLDALISRLPLGWEIARSTSVNRLYSAFGSDLAAAHEAERRRYFLFANGQELVRATKLEHVYEPFESDLDFYVARTTCSWLFVHAGVVAWRGKAIIIPGRSHSGKTTLVQALLEAGATYYSDEFAVFDREGRVLAFPRPLSVRTNGAATRIGAAQLGAQTGGTPLPVGMVILTRYKPEARWRPEVLSPGQGMLGLLQNTLAARRYPEMAFTTLQRAICQAHVLTGTRGEAKETARWIARHLDGAIVL